MATWQYFNATGIEGGDADVTRRAEKTFYVDSYKGSDVTGNGSKTTPYKSIQKVLNQCNTFSIQDVDIIATGYFEEGNFLNRRTGKTSLISDGGVVINGINKTLFSFLSAEAAGAAMNYNVDWQSGNMRRNYGSITIKDMNGGSGNVYIGCYSNGNNTILQTLTVGVYRTRIINSRVNFGFQSTATFVEGNVFKDINVATGSNVRFYAPDVGTARPIYIQKNTYINTRVICTCTSGVNSPLIFRSNYLDQTSLFDSSTGTIDSSLFVKNNHFRGTATNKISIDNGVTYYTNRELARTGLGANFDTGGIASTIDPLFNTLNAQDFTLQSSSPLLLAGHDGKEIGAYGKALGAQATDNVNWVATGVDNTTIPGDASLTASPTGTMETTNGILVVDNASTPKRLLRLTLPNALIDYINGYTIDTVRSADETTPAIATVEISTSADSTNGTDGTWIPFFKVPIDALPLIDSTNKGNGDAAFDKNTATYITLTHIKYKVTLRNNEAVLP